MVALSIYSLIILAFFVNSLVAYGLVPNAASWSIELIMILLFIEATRLKSSTARRFRLFGAGFVISFFIVCIVSAALNDTSILELTLFLRQCIRFHILLWILVTLDLPEELILKTHKLLIVLFLIQIPTAIVRLFIFGQGEKAIGTYAMEGGGNSTAIPMVAASFIVCYHYLYRKRPVSWFLVLAFLGFGVIGDKRAVVVLVPATLAFAYWLCVKDTRRDVSRMVLKISVMIAISAPTVFYFGVRLMPTLNPDDRVWGRFSLHYAIDYIEWYNRGGNQKELSFGRVESTERIYQFLCDRGPATVMFGLGPGKFLKSSFGGRDVDYFREQLTMVGVVYGIMSLNFLALQVGYVGAAIWIAFFAYAMFILSRSAQQETDPYWRAYFTSMVCLSFVVLVIASTYNNVFLENDLMSMTYMLLLAFAIRRHSLFARVRASSLTTVREYRQSDRAVNIIIRERT